MYIYIEGKEPVARKSKSLAEMGVKDGDTLIVTTEMKLPLQEYSDDDDFDDAGGIFNPLGDDDADEANNAAGQMDYGKHGIQSPRTYGLNQMQNSQSQLHQDSSHRTTLPQISTNMDLIGQKKPVENKMPMVGVPTNQNGSQLHSHMKMTNPSNLKPPM